MCVICMLGAALFMTIFRFLPQTAGLTATALVLVGAGFFIYGPQALIGIELGNQATKEASARANGIAGILGYIGSGLSGLLVGYVADAFGWTRVFETIIVIAVIGMFILSPCGPRRATDTSGPQRSTTATSRNNAEKTSDTVQHETF